MEDPDKNSCENQITIDDLIEALRYMSLDKSPGADGFTTNFYKLFWHELKQPLLDSFLFSFETGELADGQRRGLLNLIPKKHKDLRYLKSWRPVSLLATDYKILAKALAIRLQKVISGLVNSDQVGYIKGRYIGENIRTIEDLMHYTSLKKIPGIFALVDFKKAFDTVEWSFLFNALVKFNFVENFIKWIKLLYTNISSCVSNNGYISNFFTLSRGIRQGCPISAVLFILVAEILAINIRCDINIKGITVDGKAFKIGQLADDTTLFLSDVESLRQAINKFNNFGTLSGLKINLDKTEIVSLSDRKIDSVQLTGLLEGIKVATGAFKTLGVWFTCDNEISVKLNYNERIKSMQQTLHIWRARSLSWKGKITILKTLVIPQVIHLFSNIYTPMHILERIDTLFFYFLWGGKPPRVKKSTIINDYHEGGLKMPDIYSIHISQKVIWLKRLTNDNKTKMESIIMGSFGN